MSVSNKYELASGQLAHMRDERDTLRRNVDKLPKNSQGIHALAEIERLRTNLAERDSLLNDWAQLANVCDDAQAQLCVATQNALANSAKQGLEDAKI